MNAIFTIVLILSLLIMTFLAPNKILSTMQEGGINALRLSLTLFSTYAVWLSILKIMEKTSLNGRIAHLFRPITKKIFKNESEETYKFISINLASNMLGLGGAATPAGINAITSMGKNSLRPTKNMVMLTVISATSLQLLPTTVIGIMSSMGSTQSASIIIPSLLSSFISTFTGVILVQVFVK